MKKYYANVIDLSQLPPPMALVMAGWFNKDKIKVSEAKITETYVEIMGKDEEQIAARVQLLKQQKHARNGGGVRIKEVAEK